MSKSAIAAYGVGAHNNVPVDLVVASKTNPRKTFDKKADADLAASIKAKGLIQRVIVRPRMDQLEIVAGERRWRAHLAAKLKTINVDVVELSDEEVLETQIVENDQRKDVHFLEQARGYVELARTRNMTAEQIAERVGREPSRVARLLRLGVGLSPKMDAKCFDGTITEAKAMEICRLQPKDQESIDRWVLERGVGELRNYIEREFLLDLHKAAFSKSDDKLVPAVGSCDACPKRVGNQPLLFPEVKKTDTCTDRTCFNGKIEADVKQKLAAAPELIQVTTEHSNRGKTGVVYVSEYGGGDARFMEAKAAKSDPTVKKCLIIDGAKAGQVAYVTTKKPKAAVDSWQAKQREQSKKQKLERSINYAIVEAIAAKVKANATKPADNMAALATWLENRSWDTSEQIYKLMGWEWKNNHGENQLKRVAALSPDDRARLMVVLTYVGDVQYLHGGRKKLDAGAKRWGVNVAAIEKPLREAAKPKGKAKGAANANKKKKGGK